MKKRFITSLVITAILISCSTNNYDGLMVVNTSNSECDLATRSEGDINHSTLKITQYGDIFHCVLSNYEVSCGHGDLIVKCRQEGQNLSIVVNDLNTRNDGVSTSCICPLNVYFTIQGAEGKSFHVILDQKDLGEVSFINHRVVEIDRVTLEQAYEEGFDYRERLSEVVTTPMKYLPEEMPWDKPRLELSYNADMHTIYGTYWYFRMPCDYTKFDMVMDTDIDGTLVFKINTNGDYSSTCESYSQIVFKMLNAQKDEYRVKINPHKDYIRDSDGNEHEITVYDYEGVIKKDESVTVRLGDIAPR